MREQVVPWGPERCGAHINPDDPSDIAKFVVEILKDDALKRQMGKNARRRVLEKFTIQKIAEETAKIYEETIQEFSRC
jgi:glycosyltransferase involved in cell wall biosynthesis